MPSAPPSVMITEKADEEDEETSEDYEDDETYEVDDEEDEEDITCEYNDDDEDDEDENGGVPSAPHSEMFADKNGGVWQPKITHGGKSIGISGYFCSKDEESHLLNWYNASSYVDAQIRRSIDFCSISNEIGCSTGACRNKLRVFVGAGVLTQDEINDMMNVFYNYEYNQDIPSSMRLENLASVEGSIKSFQDRQDNGASAFHLTQVPPSEMSRFDKALSIQLNPSLQINQNKNDLLDSLDGNKCILADNYVRHPGVHNFHMVPNPHLRHPTTGDFRTEVHNCVHLCNNLFFALNKYRSAGDREKLYNFGRSPWSGSCDMYIVRSKDTIRSGFADVGVGLGETRGLESFGKSPFPVHFDGCYKVMWNGRGIRNAAYNYMTL